MRVMRFANSGYIPALDEVEMPKPQPRTGELRVRVHAAGVTPTEVLWYPTTHTTDGAVLTRYRHTNSPELLMPRDSDLAEGNWWFPSWEIAKPPQVNVNEV